MINDEMKIENDEEIVDTLINEMEGVFGADFDEFQNALLSLSESQREIIACLIFHDPLSGTLTSIEISKQLSKKSEEVTEALNELSRDLMVKLDGQSVILNRDIFSLWDGLMEFIDERLADLEYVEEIEPQKFFNKIAELG